MTSFRLIGDPGHGGEDRGNCHNGVVEAPFVFDIASSLMAHAMLEPSWDARLTRDFDEDPYFAERDKRARAFNASMALSIHADAGIDANGDAHPEWSGCTVFHVEHNRQAAIVAREIAGAMPRALTAPRGPRVVGLSVAEKARYPRTVNVLYGFTAPTVLVEIGYLTNPSDAAYLKTPYAKQRIVAALLAGAAIGAQLYGSAS